jgi:hypothetical protein
MVAVGVNTDGRREVLGLGNGASPDRRAVATRHEKTASSFMGILCLEARLVGIRR